MVPIQTSFFTSGETFWQISFHKDVSSRYDCRHWSCSQPPRQCNYRSAL